MSQNFYQIDAERLIIGSIDGTKKDAKEFVEAQISKYCDIPNKCHYRLRKSDFSGFHFEIQEDSHTGSILDKILELMKEDPESDVYVYDANDTQYQVYQRKDGSLRTFIRGHEDTVSPPADGIEALDGSMSRFTPYFSKATAGSVAMGIVFSFSMVGAIISAILMGAQHMAEQGYVNAIETSPVNLVLQSSSALDMHVERDNNLPINGGLNAIERFKMSQGGKVGKLQFEGGRWSVVAKKAEETPAEADADPSDAPVAPTPVEIPEGAMQNE